VSSSSAKSAAKTFFKALISRVHNTNKVDLLITLHQKDQAQSGKVQHFHCSMGDKAKGNKITVKSYKIPQKTSSSGSWGSSSISEMSGGNMAEYKKRFIKNMESKQKKKNQKNVSSDSDSSETESSSEDDLLKHSPMQTYYLYDTFLYGNTAYSTYILGRNFILPNFFCPLTNVVIFP
jgi:hypothetical protein